MMKYSYSDLKIVLILTFLSLIILLVPSLNQYPQSIVPYALLLLFIPGYSLLAACKPSMYKMDFWKCILISIGVGIVILAVVFLLWRFTPIITYLAPLKEYISPFEVYMSIIFILSAFFIIDLTTIAWARRRSLLSTQINREHMERYLCCEKCKGYYKLKEDESPEDFESCQCGGKLVYTSKSIEEASSEQKKEEPVRKGFFPLDVILVLIFSMVFLYILLQMNQEPYHTLIEFILILFLPGYALISMLYPKKEVIGGLERLAYSFAASISITALLGMVLNFTPYKDQMDPILLGAAGLTIILAALTIIRRIRVPPEKRYQPDIGGFFTNLGRGFMRETRTEKITSVMLILSFILVVSTSLITANPLEEKPYTDFYVMGTDGKTVNSLNLSSGQDYNLTTGLVNHENKKTSYRIIITSGGVLQHDQTVDLENKEKKEMSFNFTAGDPGARDMEFKLYKLPDNSNIYQIIKIPLTINELIAESTEEANVEESGENTPTE